MSKLGLVLPNPLYSPEWCRVTLASIGDAVITTDVNGCVTYLNPVAEALTGWTNADASGASLERVFHIVNQSTRVRVESLTVRALREGVIVRLTNHTILIARDGTERPIDDSAAPIRNDDNEVSGVVLVFREITERHRQEKVLADAANYTSSIIATLREPFIVLDRNLRVATANQAFYDLFQVPKEETEGRFIYELGNRQWDIPKLRKVLDDVLLHQVVHDCDIEHEFPIIGRKSMLLNARLVESVSGDPDLILLAIEDTTSRKRAEVSMQTSEMRYRRLFQTAKDGILILDAETMTVLDVNPFVTEMLGYSEAEILGRELWELVFFADREASKAAYDELRDQGYIRYDHLPLETKNGSRVAVEFVCNTYQVDNRKVAQCNIRDISERNRLEGIVQEQTAALADLHRRKDEFLAMLSHELRNPLAPIANALQLLRLQPNEAPLQRQARTIMERQMTQLTRLVDELMEVSRITTGRVRLLLETVPMNGVVERAVETVRPLVDRHQHMLAISYSPEPIWLHADPTRLEQVIVNLLTNAVKYTEDGGRIELTVRQESETCVVRISDNGVGITPELLPRMFELFTQAERSLDRSQGGLGIGLALVQRLVELHGGGVTVQSSVGVGSEFVVRLPAVVAVPPVADAAPPSSLPSVASLCRVLVVDDNVDAAESLALLLIAAGHDVCTAQNGTAALQHLETHTPDVALLDIGLPEFDGYELARLIQLRPECKNVLLVAMTGYGQESDRQKSKDAGFKHHLVKPAHFAKLLEILATVGSARA